MQKIKGEYLVKELIMFLVSLSIVLFMSWLIACGIIKMITMCLGIVFSWKIATAIWLITVFINGFIRKGGEK